jgi:hypothetical protein
MERISGKAVKSDSSTASPRQAIGARTNLTGDLPDRNKIITERIGEQVSVGILLLMTVATGIVDAVSFLALGRVFTANMTGNVVLLGFAFAGVPGLSISRSALALLAFLFGAVLGGRVAF